MPARAGVGSHAAFCVGLNLLVILVTAWTSVTFFHPDEHYQVLEFVGFKQGVTPEAELPWEFAARARPWMQPAIYYALLSPLAELGLRDRFVMAFILRLVSGVLAFGAMLALLDVSATWFQCPKARTWRLHWVALAGMVPYLAVRTSSENVSASFFLLGFALLLRGRSPEQRGADERSLRPAEALGAGVLLGLAFECRFQCAFMIVGLLAWLLWIKRASARELAWVTLGALVPVLAAVFIDRWGYGEWVFPPWSYLRVNLIEGKAAEYGTKWFGAYVHITLANIFAPVVMLAWLGLGLCWVRRPRHVLTWTTLPFVFVHCLLSHKEERFLFPVLLLSLVAAALGVEAGTAEPSRAARVAARVAARFRGFQRSRTYRFAVVWNFLGMALLALYPLGWRPHHVFAEWVYRSVPAPVHFAFQDAKLLPSVPFFRNGPWTSHVVPGPVALASLDSDGAPIYWLRREPFSALQTNEQGVSPELLFSEFPGFSSEWLRTHLWPTLDRLRSAAIASGFQPKRATWISVYRLAPRAPGGGPPDARLRAGTP